MDKQHPIENISRRHFLKACSLAGASLIIPSSAFSTAPALPGSSNFPETIAALQAAYQNEIEAHQSYTAFSKTAKSDDYPNIAYLFTAFATSELIHAGQFKKTLENLGTTIEDRKITVKVAKTKTNLENASKHEIELIERFYPESIKRIEPEQHEAAIDSCRYAWESHKQHREHIYQINRYTALFFWKIAKIIEGEKLQFFVCNICGSTEKAIPQKNCPICAKSSTQYRVIERNSHPDKR